MRFRRPYHNLFFGAIALALGVFCFCVRAQNIIIHLENGDRITGYMVSESPAYVTISNTWSREILIPKTEIKNRETLPSPPTVAGTNIFGAPGSRLITNIIVSTNGTVTTNIFASDKPISSFVTMRALPSAENDFVNSNLLVFVKRWKGEASVGEDIEQGAVDHQLYYGKAKLTYEQPYEVDKKESFKNILNYEVAYGRTDGTLSDNRMSGSSKTDFDLTHTVYVYNLGGGFYDEIRKIDLHYEDGPGAGYHWLRHGTNLTSNIELGANYQVEYRSDNTSTESAYYRFGEDLAWKINKQVNFNQKFEYFPRVGYATQGRMRFESNLSYALFLNFSLNFTLIDFYDTQPAATVPNNDFQVRTTLGVKF